MTCSICNCFINNISFIQKKEKQSLEAGIEDPVNDPKNVEITEVMVDFPGILGFFI